MEEKVTKKDIIIRTEGFIESEYGADEAIKVEKAKDGAKEMKVEATSMNYEATEMGVHKVK